LEKGAKVSGMRVLFVHQNFPGQFRHLVPALRAQGHEIVAMTMNGMTGDPGVPVVRSASKHGTAATHPWARDLEAKVIRAETTLRSAQKLREQGFMPDVIIAHPGWGDTMFLKNVWPEARLGIYCELYYRTSGSDHDFDPEFLFLQDPVEAQSHFQLRNLHQRWHFNIANAAISPTRFQASTYPADFQPRIDVIHDGIDTALLKPNPDARLTLASGQELTRDDEVITFVARNLEPVRGYHILMRALPELLRRRPKAQVVIVGADDVSYGSAPPKGKTWKQVFLSEVEDRIDPSRVHFTGRLPYGSFVTLLQLSRLHIYMTYPFVLSWSLMEAMAIGAPILASDTAPLREVITHGENGLLFPFFDTAVLVDRACEMLDDPALRERLSAAGREKILREYDLRTVCLPRQLAWIDRLYRAFPASPHQD
jgi:glycosyltransferase involved in cell wall biosynthesis